MPHETAASGMERRRYPRFQGFGLMANIGGKLVRVTGVSAGGMKLEKGFKLVPESMRFTLYPTEGTAVDVPLGADFDLKKGRKLAIKLVNPNDVKLNFKIRSVPLWESQFTVPAGFEQPPSYAWMKPASDTVTLEGNSIKETALIINIPDDDRYAGKAYFFSIAVEVLEQEISARVYYKLGVRTQSSRLRKAAAGGGK